MTRIITKICEKHAACVEVCPVDCIHPRAGEDGLAEAAQLFVNPDECIDCGACEAVCPVNAIFAEEEVPEKYQNSIQANYKHYK